MLVTPENLSLTVLKNVLSEIKELKEKLPILQHAYVNHSATHLDINSKSAENQSIPTGSRVEILYDNGTVRQGRVWGKVKNQYKNEYQVNKDGCKTYENISATILKNISIGYLPELERDIWITKTKIIDFEMILNYAESSLVINSEGLHIIEVVQIDNYYPCDLVHFVLAENLKSDKITLPQKSISSIGFYEFKIVNNLLVTINLSSKTAFEMAFKNRA